MKKNDSSKPVKIKIEYELPEGHSGLKFGKNEFGQLQIVDQNGSEIKPVTSTRSTLYERVNKPKYQSVIHQDNNYTTIGGLKELTELNSFFVIDTNTELIGSKRVSVSFLMRLRLINVEGGYKVEPVDNNVFVFEFIAVPEDENPEMLAIMKLANDILATEIVSQESSILFFNDSELGKHHDFSSQSIPIYGSHFLPKQFRVVYASSDTGSDFINQLFRIADKNAKEYLRKVKNGTFASVHHSPLKEDSRVLFTCHSLPLEKFEMDIIQESTGVFEEIKFS